MPNNKELAAEAEALSAELETQVATDGLKNDELAQLVSDLKAQKAASDDEDTATAVAMAKPTKKKPEFYVAPRCAVTTKRGILSGDTEDEVKATDFPQGEKDLAAFIESGHVLKGG